MSSTLITLRTEVYRLIGEDSSSNSRVPTGMVDNALNRMATKFARETGCIWNTKLQNIVSGTASYSITMTASVRPFRVKEVIISLQAGDTSRQPLKRFDDVAMGLFQTNWKKISNAVPKYYISEPSAKANTTFQVTLVPAPNYSTTSGEGVEIMYYRLPTAMSGTGDNLDIPDRWEDAIIAGACMELLAALGHANAYWVGVWQEAIAQANMERMWSESKGVVYGRQFGLGAQSVDGGLL